MNRQLYTLLLYLLSPVIGLYFVYRGFFDPRYFFGLKQRLGFLPSTMGLDFDSTLEATALKKSIHIHCASVGETLAAKTLIEKIAKQYTEFNLVITSTSATGKNEVNQLIAQLERENIKHKNIIACYLPVDWPKSCQRFIKRAQPQLTILLETEVWPNLIHQLSKKAIPIVLANGRLSDISLKKYQKYPSFSQTIFSNITLIAAQYKSDKDNFLALGVSDNKIKLTGNLKFDLQVSNQLTKKQKTLKQQWGANRPAWIALSIHPKEFELVLRVHQKLLSLFPDLLLIAVPRHPECFSLIKQQCQKHHLPFVSRSQSQDPNTSHPIVLGDTMGEILLMCGAADISFVGGSLINYGGHNPLEPAACGLPVIIGDSYYNFSDVCRIMEQNNSLEIIKNETELFEIISALVSSPELRQMKSLAAKRTLENHRGAVDKTMSAIAELLRAC